MTKELKTLILLTVIAAMPFARALSQNVSGPTCILTGTQYSYGLSEYDYNNNDHNFSYTVTDGVLSTGGTTGSSSGSGPGSATILVTWNSGISSGTIALTSSMGKLHADCHAGSCFGAGGHHFQPDPKPEL